MKAPSQRSAIGKLTTGGIEKSSKKLDKDAESCAEWLEEKKISPAGCLEPNRVLQCHSMETQPWVSTGLHDRMIPMPLYVFGVIGALRAVVMESAKLRSRRGGYLNPPTRRSGGFPSSTVEWRQRPRPNTPHSHRSVEPLYSSTQAHPSNRLRKPDESCSQYGLV